MPTPSKSRSYSKSRSPKCSRSSRNKNKPCHSKSRTEREFSAEHDSSQSNHVDKNLWMDKWCKYGLPRTSDYQVIVENLPSQLSWQQLRQYMQQGRCEVTYAITHKPIKNVGCVQFANKEDMDFAIENLNGTELNGRKIKIFQAKNGYSYGRLKSRCSRSQSHSGSRSGRCSRSQSHSGSRSRKCSRSQSRSGSRSQRCSKSKSHSRSRSQSCSRSSQSHSNSKRERQYSGIKDCYSSQSNPVDKNRQLWLDKYALPRSTDYQVIVENLSSKISWQDLREYMRQGSCEVTYAITHKPIKNVGCVHFSNKEDMEYAIENLNGTELNGRKLKIFQAKKGFYYGRSKFSCSRSQIMRSQSNSESRFKNSSRSNHCHSRSRRERKFSKMKDHHPKYSSHFDKSNQKRSINWNSIHRAYNRNFIPAGTIQNSESRSRSSSRSSRGRDQKIQSKSRKKHHPKWSNPVYNSHSKKNRNRNSIYKDYSRNFIKGGIIQN